jgi:hypothetical protein
LFAAYHQAALSTFTFIVAIQSSHLPSTIPQRLTFLRKRNPNITGTTTGMLKTTKIATIISMTKTLGMPQYMADQSHTDTPEWIDWVFAHINLDQIREITGRLFSQNFRANYKAEHGISFRVVTLEPSIPKLEEEPVEEEQGQWEIGSNDEIPGFGNFE